MIGLPYTAEIRTMYLALGSIGELGTVNGREVSIPQMAIDVEQTRGIQVGTDAELLNDVFDERQHEASGDPLEAFTGRVDVSVSIDYDTDGSIIIRQTDPLPMTIQGVSPDVRVGVKIVVAQRCDIDVVVEDIRERDAVEVYELSGETVRMAMERSVKESVWTCALIQKDRAMAVFGLAEAAPGVGVPWLLGTDRLEAHARTCLPFARVSSRT